MNDLPIMVKANSLACILKLSKVPGRFLVECLLFGSFGKKVPPIFLYFEFPSNDFKALAVTPWERIYDIPEGFLPPPPEEE